MDQVIMDWVENAILNNLCEVYNEDGQPTEFLIQ